MIGMAVCSVLLRQMEFHADQCEIRLCGSKNFEATGKRLRHLSLASMRAQQELMGRAVRGELITNYPAMVAEIADGLTHEQRRKIEKMVADEQTGLFDSHPSDKDRVAAAKKANAPALFELELPATVLFSNPQVLCENVTNDIFGILKRH